MEDKSVFTYLKSRRFWCWLSLLLIAEMIVFAVLNTTPNDHYSQYVSESLGANESVFGFILLGNLRSSLILVLIGIIPLGLGTVFGTYMIVTGLIATVKWLLPEIGGSRLLLCVLWSRAVTLAIIRLCRRKPVLAPLKECGIFLLKSMVYVLIPLVLTAAVMEVTVSSWVMNSII